MRRAVVAAVMGLLLAGLWGCERPEEPPVAVDGTDQEGTPDESEELRRSGGPYMGYEDVDPVDAFDVGPPAPAVYFLSGLKGYTEPCGCTADVLLGGIDRITAYALDAGKLHPAAVLIDAGDWVFEHPEIPEHMVPQETAKASVLAAAHRRMGTLFTVPGIRDLAMGLEFYEDRLEEADLTAVAANLTFRGEPLPATRQEELDGLEVLFVGLVDHLLYEGIEEVEATDAGRALREVVGAADVDALVVVFQGRPERAEELLGEAQGVDFLIVGHDPRRRDEATPVGSGHLLEAYDQGRYVGRLKLYARGTERPYRDGREGIAAARENLQNQIAVVEQDLRILEVRTGGDENPLADRLTERLEELQERELALLREGIEIPEEARGFLYDLVPMEPGYRLDEELRERRVEFNRSLAELNRDLQREVIPVEDGEPFFIGTAECTVCHVPAHEFWETTSHSRAVATLEVRDKQYDQNCIGCHVVGWEEPGGSVLGQIVYEAELGGRTFEKDLNNVGCESCHGPGSEHRLQPIDAQGVAQHIIAQPTEAQCTQCHVPEHSPRFDFDVYVQEVTGPGHEFRGVAGE